jgi:hypothetical protein
MYKVGRAVPMLFAFILTLAVGISLAAVSPETSSTTKNASTAMKAKPSANKAAMKSMTANKTEASKTQKRQGSRALASAENLSGTITNVDRNDKEVTLLGPNGVPYDFHVTSKTLLELSNNKIRANQMSQLSNENQKQATIRFVPMSNGNLAKNIQITTS